MKFSYDVKDDIQYSLESRKIDLDYFCKINDLSRKTIYNQCNVSSNYKTLNKIYNGIYNLNVRISKIKAEVFKELDENNKITLFHGSKKGLDNVCFNGSRADCDFGSGFYLAENFESALSFVENFNESSVYAFRLNLDNLKIVELNTNLEWMLLICHFRKNLDITEVISELLDKINNADLIIAPIADNKMFEILNDFQNGLITTTQALHALSASRLGKQYVIKTEKACNQLEFLSHLFICDKEKEDSSKKSIERSNEIESKVYYAKREFRNQGKYIDELIK